jgi:hypothetical protein
MKKIKFLHRQGILLFAGIALSFSSCIKEEDNNPSGSVLADAGDDIEAYVGQEVLLNGSGSKTATGTPAFFWEFTSKPDGSNSILTNVSSVSPSFIPDLEGVYDIELTVISGNAESKDNIKVTATLAPDASIIVNGSIDSDVTWSDHVEDPSIPDYIISGTTYVNARLTIEPNVFIEVAENTGLIINQSGTFISAGTEGQEVIFTSTSPGEGIHWSGLVIGSNSALNKVEYTKILYAGNSGFLGPTNAYAINIIQGRLSLINSTVSNSMGYGIYTTNGQLNEFRNNVFSENSLYDLALPAVQAAKLDSETFFSDPKFAVEIFASTIKSTEDLILPELSNMARYYVNGNIILQSYLELKAGAILDFAQNTGLTVDTEGTLVANGTEQKPVVFTSKRAEEEIHWKGIHFKSIDPRNALVYSEISFAGSSEWSFPGPDYAAAIGIEDASIIIKNSSIMNSMDYGIYMHSGSIKEFGSNIFSGNAGHAIAMMADQVKAMDSNTTFINNGWDGVTVYKSTLIEESNWVKLNGESKYRIIAPILVEAGLNLSAGATINLDSEVHFIVQNSGYLSAKGTETDRITMTTSNLLGGIYWGGIWFKTKDLRNELDYVDFSYGGGYEFNFSGPNFSAVIAGDNANEPRVSITNSSFEDNKNYTIYWEAGTINDVLSTEANNTFINNGLDPDVVINP